MIAACRGEPDVYLGSKANLGGLRSRSSADALYDYAP